MADNRIPPSAPEAEVAVLGSVLANPTALTIAVDEHRIQASYFYAMKHQIIWGVIQTMHATGVAVDPVTVAEALSTESGYDGGLSYLMDMVNATPMTSNIAHYAKAIYEAAMLRRLLGASADIATTVYGRAPLEVALDSAEAAIINVQRQAGSLLGSISGLVGDIDEVISDDQDLDTIVPWVIPGLLRVRERLIVVAGPGTGKSTFLRQLAHCAANGLHPWTGGYSSVSEQRVLLVELEAQPHNIKASTNAIRWKICRLIGDETPSKLARVPILMRPGEGLNVRDPEARADLIEAIRRYKPTLVCMGPLKYMYGAKHGETFDETAVAVQRLINPLMDRYGFAVAIEAHTNRADQVRPTGSERWVDWPDVGFALTRDASTPMVPHEPTIYDITQFRLPRNENVTLPTTLIRNGAKLPWTVGDAPDNWFNEYMGRWTLSTTLPFRRAPAKVGAYMRDPEEER